VRTVPGDRQRTVLRWALLLAACAAVGLLADGLGIPSPALVAGLAVGLAVALGTRWGLDLPMVGMRLAQAILGVSLGLLVTPETLRALGGTAAPIVLVLVLSLTVTIVAGPVMTRISSVDRPTATFGMIAGGASGIVAISRDLGADERQVAVMQYLRVLVITVTVPVVAGIAGNGGAGISVAPSGDGLHGLLTTVVCILVGTVLARVTRLPVGSLLGPLIVAAAVSAGGAPGVAPVPAPLLEPAYAAIGLAVGLRFTLASLRAAARTLPATLTMIVVLIVLSAAIGLLLVPLADVPALDAYLATSPGGLYAVLAASASNDVDTTLVLTIQVLRLFSVLLIAPFLGRRLARADARAAGDADPPRTPDRP
jgi:membrane AbrB-like protein